MLRVPTVAKVRFNVRKLDHSDMPIVRSVRDAYRALIAEANRQKRIEDDPAILLAYATVLDDLHGKFDHLGKQLSRLERTPA